MKNRIIAALSIGLFCFQITTIGQSVKLTKEEKKQERRNIDSLFIVYSLPIDIEAAKGFPYLDLRDSVIENLKSKGYNCPGNPAVANLIKEKMMDFLPSPFDREKYSETMEKIARDKNYVLQLLEQADPFMQRIELVHEKDENETNIIRVKRQNYPNGRKMRAWTFKYYESEPTRALANRIVDTLTNTIKTQ